LVQAGEVEAGARAALSVPIIEVSDLRLGFALAAEAVHRFPSRALAVVGVTGTNGKTTSTYLIERAIAGAGGLAARLGTLGFALGGEFVDSPLTTPEADEISRYLARARSLGASHFVMEVSSHALDQRRADALRFHTAAFTNLTQDHLDYHGTMEAYGAAKARLFTELAPAASVISVDDAFGRSLAERAAGRVLRVSRGAGTTADIKPLEIAQDARGLRGKIQLPSGTVALTSRLVGEHNLDNLLTTLACAEALGLDVARAAASLADAPEVPGRLERCDEPGDDVMVLVDYAHTPDALTRALAAVRGLVESELVCVFGCGGDRDPTKRPKMGDAVGRAAHRAIITNDNPRTEDPQKIAGMIEPAVRACGIPYDVILDRAEAIRRAVLEAKPGSVVLIAGKGHEPYQIMGTTKRDFDDRVEARRSLALRRGASRPAERA
jgi:UDP-N-acetylmuramoyl-L-alanyl-D-glutamate--2,6-diaminopimelate ligase